MSWIIVRTEKVEDRRNVEDLQTYVDWEGFASGERVNEIYDIARTDSDDTEIVRILVKHWIFTVLDTYGEEGITAQEWRMGYEAIKYVFETRGAVAWMDDGEER